MVACAPAGRAGLQGIASFAEARPGASEAGQKVAAQVFSALCALPAVAKAKAGHGLERKEASLLTSTFVSFGASKEKEPMRRLSIRKACRSRNSPLPIPQYCKNKGQLTNF